jgi:hypothetical protein
MESFNTMSAASPGDAMGLNPAMTANAGLGIDGFDQDLKFDDTML